MLCTDGCLTSGLNMRRAIAVVLLFSVVVAGCATTGTTGHGLNPVTGVRG